MGEGATDEVARSASRSLRSASKMMVSSADGGEGGGGIGALLFGDAEPCLGGDGVTGRKPVRTERPAGRLQAGSDEADGESSMDKEANAASRSLEWRVQNCM